MAEKTNIIQCFTHFWQVLINCEQIAIVTCTSWCSATNVNVKPALNAIIGTLVIGPKQPCSNSFTLGTLMICNPYEIIIQGITSSGREFRPSDWAERLSGILSTFGVDQKLSYAPFVRPMVHNNVRCVAVDRQLEKVDPRVYEFIMTFARDNDLQVVDCRSLIKGIER